jgi:hypothetical protein
MRRVEKYLKVTRVFLEQFWDLGKILRSKNILPCA